MDDPHIWKSGHGEEDLEDGDEVLEFGWRALGTRGLAYEVFCTPPHRGILEHLNRVGHGVMHEMGEVIWSVNVRGTLKLMVANQHDDKAEITLLSAGRELAKQGMDDLEALYVALLAACDYPWTVNAYLDVLRQWHDDILAEMTRRNCTVNDLTVYRRIPLPDKNPHSAAPSVGLAVAWNGKEVEVCLPGIPKGDPFDGATEIEQEFVDDFKALLADAFAEMRRHGVPRDLVGVVPPEPPAP